MKVVIVFTTQVPFPAPLHREASFPGAFVNPSSSALDRRTSTTGLGTSGKVEPGKVEPSSSAMYHSSAGTSSFRSWAICRYCQKTYNL